MAREFAVAYLCVLLEMTRLLRVTVHYERLLKYIW